MAKFLFKLESVLRHRQQAQRQAQRLLAERSAVAAGLEADLKRLNQELTQSTDALRAGGLVGRIDLTYLTAHRRYTADVTRRGTALMQRLALAQRGVEEARRALVEAMRRRKALETLREHRLAAWRADLQRRELSEADDIATRATAAEQREAREDDSEVAAEWLARATHDDPAEVRR